MKRLAEIALCALVLSACTGGSRSEIHPGTSASAIPRGGTLVAGLYGQVPTSLDPQSQYNFSVWELWRCCLGRTLLSYNGREADKGGAVPRPDLATAMASVSSDGLTWIFRIKPGIHYAPPMADSTIVAADFVRALERMASRRVNPPGGYTYDFYYSVIGGFDAYRRGRSSSISGLHTPNDNTLIVQLTRPQNDLPYLFTLPATAPIPPSPADPSAPFGVAMGHDDDYGRFLVSSGPYMIEGSPDLDLSLLPKQQDAVSGYHPFRPTFDADGNFIGGHGQVTLVRNPSWAADADPLRAAYPDRIRLLLNEVPGGASPLSAISRAIKQGRLDMIFDADSLPSDISSWENDPELKPFVFSLTDNAVWFLTMNLAQPPFDDLDVRRAVALAIDRADLARISSSGYEPGPALAATHLVSDAVEGGFLASSSGASLGAIGDIEAARGAMQGSRYDADGDGRCDAVVCRHVELLVANYGCQASCENVKKDTGQGFPFERVSNIVGEITRELSGVGIGVRVRKISNQDTVRALATDPKRHVAMTLAAWQADYPSGSAFFPYWFDGRRIGEPDTYAVSLLGATREQLAAWGYDVGSVPSVNDRLGRCLGLVGRSAVQCWAELDSYLTSEVVPWVPLLFTESTRHTSTRIASFSWNGALGFPALDRIALKPGASS